MIFSWFDGNCTVVTDRIFSESIPIPVTSCTSESSQNEDVPQKYNVTRTLEPCDNSSQSQEHVPGI